MNPQRQPLLRRGSSQVSDPDVHSDLTNPPTPVVEGKHMQCRYIPLDLEKSQAKIDPSYNGDRKELESQTQQDAHFAPIIWALRDSEEEDSLARLAKYYHYLQYTLWILIGTFCFCGAVNMPYTPQKHSQGHENWFTLICIGLAMVFAIVLCLDRVPAVKAMIWRERGWMLHGWLCCYNVLPPVLALCLVVLLEVRV